MSNDRRVEIRGSLLARNTLLNFIGQVVPLLVGVVTIPFIVRGLGIERFGVLSLTWVILGYFAIFDLGLGRATTKYVAEALGKGEEDQIPHLVWTAVTIQVVLGVLGTLVLISITPLLVERILNISPWLMEEAKTTFYLLAISIPLVLVSSSFSGVLEAKQRFDLVNAVKIPSSVATFLLVLIGVLSGLGLSGILALLLFARVFALIALFVLDLRIFPKLKQPLLLSTRTASQLFAFGGWVAISNMISPLLRYLDRFIIGALLSVSAVTYYSVPFDIMGHLGIIPSSLVLTLFPAFSSLSGSGHNKRTQEFFLRSVKYLIILVAPLILILITFARPVLQIWLGGEFAENSTLVLQILLIGAFIGVLAPIPGGVLQGYGRPDIITKLYLMYIPLNIALVWFLVKNMGLPGAALSFALRALIETVLLFFFSSKLIGIYMTTLLGRLYRAVTTVSIIGFLVWLSSWANRSLIMQLVFTCIILTIFALIIWRWVLNSEDKIMLLSFLGRGCK